MDHSLATVCRRSGLENDAPFNKHMMESVHWHDNQDCTCVMMMFIVVGLLEWWAGRNVWSHADHQCVLDMDTSSRPNSQYAFDPWLPGHVNHGVFFVAVLLWLFPRFQKRLVIALALGMEACWEIVENQDCIVKRFRMRGYIGDSVVNSFVDILACWMGAQLAWCLGVRRSIYFVVVVEIVSFWLWNDNVLRNISRLCFPD